MPRWPIISVAKLDLVETHKLWPHGFKKDFLFNLILL